MRAKARPLRSGETSQGLNFDDCHKLIVENWDELQGEFSEYFGEKKEENFEEKKEEIKEETENFEEKKEENKEETKNFEEKKEENKEETGNSEEKKELIDYFNSVVEGYEIGNKLFGEEDDKPDKEEFD